MPKSVTRRARQALGEPSDHDGACAYCRPVEYDAVKHSHIVPVGFLKAWTIDDMITMHLRGKSLVRDIGVRDAAVRTDQYARTRPATGEKIYDVEWSLGKGENAMLPVFRGLAERWPPNADAKSKLGQFIGMQFMRGPAMRDFQVKQSRRFAEELAREDGGETYSAEDLEETVAAMTHSTTVNTKMLNFARAMAVLAISMHWTLVEFKKGTLVTSDHPVIVWPLGRKAATPQPNNLHWGIGKALEISLAISPTHLLLLTWRASTEDEYVVVDRSALVRGANTFVIANAEKQWFSRPGQKVWTAHGRHRPLSQAIYKDYDATLATGSRRRKRAVELTNEELAKPLSNDPLSVYLPR